MSRHTFKIQSYTLIAVILGKPEFFHVPRVIIRNESKPLVILSFGQFTYNEVMRQINRAPFLARKITDAVIP